MCWDTVFLIYSGSVFAQVGLMYLIALLWWFSKESFSGHASHINAFCRFDYFEDIVIRSQLIGEALLE